MQRLLVLTAAAATLLSACTNVPAPEPTSPLLRSVGSFDGRNQFVGWLSHHGEFQLYDSRQSLAKQREAPHCVSGVAPALTSRELAAFDGYRVEVIGVLVDYQSLPEEIPDYPIARKVLGGKIVTNWCFGEKVLLARSIRRI